MLIRTVTGNDLEALGKMGRDFYAAGDLPGRFEEAHFAAFWAKVLDAETGVIIIGEEAGQTVGTIGGLVYEDPNNGDIVAQEMFWWVDQANRGAEAMRLIDGFEAWARDQQAVRIVMSAVCGMRDRALGRVYRGRGYREVETNYIKELVAWS